MAKMWLIKYRLSLATKYFDYGKGIFNYIVCDSTTRCSGGPYRMHFSKHVNLMMAGSPELRWRYHGLKQGRCLHRKSAKEAAIEKPSTSAMEAISTGCRRVGFGLWKTNDGDQDYLARSEYIWGCSSEMRGSSRVSTKMRDFGVNGERWEVVIKRDDVFGVKE
ncbi:hypothetical protein PIB30_083704 [Stylosanthes scabra]|uniref:Uncharacterized protein n=1 Tax=Stylosanthes scabra TaxID=79078 RepID=A0ABU6RTJ2_9FABA|nr:hypothetical protein [Stylosanthes scabra]